MSKQFEGQNDHLLNSTNLDEYTTFLFQVSGFTLVPQEHR